MISRRLFVTGSSALMTAAATGAAQASSILELLFDGDRQVIYEAPERDLPAPIDQPRPKKKAKKVATAKPKKKGGKSYKIDPIYEPQEVEYYDGEEPGTIVINSEDKFLFLVEEGNRARRYGVAIGIEGLGWTGEARVASKVEWPSWTPTDEMIARSPEHYAKYKDGMPGGPTNPLGARAMYLYQGKTDTHIRIHGTTQPWTIGSAASNGCFRMVNEHVMDLYRRVRIGTRVVVL